MIVSTWNRVCCQIKNQKIAFLILGLYALTSGMTSSILHPMVTTLEKRFDLDSSEVAWLLTANDIGNVVAVIFIAYYGGHGKHVRVLVLSAFGLGLSGFIMAMPFLIFGSRYTPEELIGSSKHNSSSSLQFASLTLTAACSGHANGSAILQTSDIQNQKIAAIVLQMIGGILTGVSTSPFWNVGLSFIDDIMGKRSGMYLGVLYCVRALAPICGYAYSSFLNTLNESLKFFDYDYPGGQKDPFWIGAWWMGFISLGACVLLTAPCMALFNRKAMIERAKEADHDRNSQKDDELEIVNDLSNSEDNKRNAPVKKLTLKDLFGVIKEYWTNPVFAYFAIGKLIGMIGDNGIAAFYPKFIEFHFRLPASDANLLFSLVIAGSAIIGAGCSGIISQKFPLSNRGNILYNSLVNTIALLLGPILMIFACTTVPIMGSDNESPDFDCSPKNCSCPFTYRPVCVDNQNYFTACQAGCLSFNASTLRYLNCLCKNMTAETGVCKEPCPVTYHYAVTLFVLRIISSISAVQMTQFLMSIGKPETKPFGLATLSFLSGIVGFVVPPIVGSMVADICLLQNPSAQGKSFCVSYDVDEMRVTLHLLSFVPNLIGSVFLFVAWYKAPIEKKVNEEVDEKDAVKDPGYENKGFSDMSAEVTSF